MLTSVTAGDLSNTQKNSSQVLDSKGKVIANYTDPDPIKNDPKKDSNSGAAQSGNEAPKDSINPSYPDPIVYNQSAPLKDNFDWQVSTTVK